MFTCYRVKSVEYYVDETVKARIAAAEKLLDAAQKALDAGSTDEVSRLLPLSVDDIAAGNLDKVRGHIAAQRVELSAAVEQLAKDENSKDAEATLDRVENALGIKRGRDRMAYYTDNGAGEDVGIWWTPNAETGMPLGKAKRGDTVNNRVFRDLANGINPTTGISMIQNTKPERTAAYDMQFAAPKSVSVLWACASPEERARLVAAHKAAVTRALEFAHAEGLIETRRGKGGEDREPVEDCAVASFTHTTSRAGDPQLHDHAVLLNVCIREDGTTGTLDNAAILRYQGAMGAVYRAELAASLERDFGLAVERQKRAFEVVGVPADLVEKFSKRREAINEAMEAKGRTTAGDREGAQIAALNTRTKKDDVPDRAELEARWTSEIQRAGWSKSAVWLAAKGAHLEAQEKAQEQPELADKATQRQEAARAAVAALEATSSVQERRHLMREVIERCQGIGNADEALEAVDELVKSGHLVQVGTGPEAEPMYATPDMIATERRMLKSALTRKGEREFVPPRRVEAAIARREGMSEEQAEAVRHALNNDGVSVVEGAAGSGKSFSLNAVANAARDCGKRVWTIAPSWKATDVVRSDTETAEEMAKAVQGFLNRVTDPEHKDAIDLTADDVIVVDEAGMIGTRDMATLLRAAEWAGAKVVLTGDTRQLQPVAAGSPMAAIASLCGTQRIETIRRQKDAGQRAASVDFATGEATRALEHYDRTGKIAWADDRADAVAALVNDWRADVQDNPQASRLVLATRNKDVRDLNGSLRQAYRETGGLTGSDTVLEAISRGEHGQREALALAAGDRVIFGESVTVNGVSVNNSDMGTVEYVGGGDDPIFRVRLDKGQTVTGKWSEFVGWRPQDAKPEDRCPKIQHGYAVTVHASQGTTVDRAFAFNSSGMGMESVYVAMTRHRLDAKLYIDTSRIRDRLDAAASGGKLKVSRKSVDAHDSDDDPSGLETGKVELAEIKQEVWRESMRSDNKANVSDFVEDKAAWAMREDPTPAPAPQTAPQTTTERAAAMDEKKQPAPVPPVPARPFGGPRMGQPPARPIPQPETVAAAVLEKPEVQPVPVPAAPTRRQAFGATRGPLPVPPPQTGADVSRRVEQRRQGPAYPVPPAPQSRNIYGLSDGEELNYFGQNVNLVDLAVKKGWTVTSKSGNADNAFANSYRLEKNGVSINVTPPGRTKTGTWLWCYPNNSSGGGVVKFLQEVEGYGRGTLGRIRSELREFLGHTPPRPTPLAPRAEALRQDLRQPGYQVAEPRGFDFASVRNLWGKMTARPNEWLIQARGIKPEVLERFAADIRTEGDRSRQNPGGACFAHRNEVGEIIGYERKGRKHHPLDERSFSQWSKGGDKRITRMGDTENPADIYVGESAIDLLSVYQFDGQPGRALLCSIYGAGSAEAYHDVAQLAAKHPGARIHLCFDNDPAAPRLNAQGELYMKRPAGDMFTEVTTAAIRELAPGANIQIRHPSPEFKDWNDCIRGQTVEMGQAAYAANLAKFTAPDAKLDDRNRALLRIAKDQNDAELSRLWQAQDQGTMTPNELRQGVQALREKLNTLAGLKKAHTDFHNDEANAMTPEALNEALADLTRRPDQKVTQRSAFAPKSAAEKEAERLAQEAARRVAEEAAKQQNAPRGPRR